MNYAPEVDVHQPVHILQIGFFNGIGVGHAGIVDDDIDSTKAPEHLLGEGRHCLDISDVDLDRQHLDAGLLQLGLQPCQSIHIQVGQGQSAMLMRQTPRSCATDT